MRAISRFYEVYHRQMTALNGSDYVLLVRDAEHHRYLSYGVSADRIHQAHRDLNMLSGYGIESCLALVAVTDAGLEFTRRVEFPAANLDSILPKLIRHGMFIRIYDL